MKLKVPRSMLDARASGRPVRAAGAAGTLVGLLAMAAVATSGAWIAAVLAGLAAGSAVFLPFRYLITGQMAAVQEMRELWGLSGLFADGRVWPAPGGWALRAGAIIVLLQEIRLRKLRTVVELGPGASSIILGRADPELAMFGLEHDPHFLMTLEDSLALHGVARYRPIRAPLRDLRIEGDQVTWYDRDSLAGLPEQIDVLIVDGPPNGEGRGNRSPAWPELRSRMRSGGIVLVDDTDRPDERAMVARWCTEGLNVIQDGGEYVLLEVT